MVNAGFNPLEEISRKTGKSIGELKEEMSKGAISAQMVQDAFISATSAGGKFYGMSAEGAKTLNGQISMLQESFDNMFNEIGKGGQGPVMTVLKAGTHLVEHYERVGKIIAGLVATYGVYRTAVALAIIVDKAHTASMTFKGYVLDALKKKWAALNLTMLTNPYVLVATAVVGLVAAVWALGDSSTAAEREAKRLQDRQEQQKKASDDLKTSVDDLMTVVQDETAAETKRQEALAELQKLMPSVFSKYKTEKELLEDLANARKAENEEIERKQNLLGRQNYEDDKSSLEKLRRYRKLASKPLGQLDKSEEKELQNLFRALVKANVLKQSDAFGIDSSFLYEREKALAGSINKQASSGRAKAAAAWNVKLKGMNKEEMEAEAQKNEGYMSTLNREKKSYIIIDGIPTTRAEIKRRIEEGKKAAKDFYTPAERKAQLKKGLDEAQKALKDFDNSKTKYSTAEAEKKRKELKAAVDSAEKAYKDFGGETGKGKANGRDKRNTEEQRKRDLEDYNAKEKGFAQAANELELKVSESFAAAIDEAREKELESMKQKHKEEMLQLDKEKAEYLDKKRAVAKAKAKAEGKAFDSSGVTLTKDEEGKFSAIKANAERRQQNEERGLYKSLLDEYQDFEARRKAVHEKFDSERKALEKVPIDPAEKERAIAELERKRKESIKSINNEEVEAMQKSSDLLVRLFTDASDLSTKEIRKAVLESEALLDYLRTTAAEGIEPNFGFTAEQLKSLQSSPEMMKSLTEQVKKFKEAASKGNPFKVLADDISNIFKKSKDGKESTEAKLKKLGASVSEVADIAGNAAGKLADMFAAAGNDSAAEAMETMQGVMSSVSNIGKGFAQGGLAGGIMAAAGEAIGFVTKAFQAAAVHKTALKEILKEATAQQRAYNLALLEERLEMERASTVFGTMDYSKATNAVGVMKDAYAALNKEIQGTERQQWKYSKEAAGFYRRIDAMFGRPATGTIYSKLKDAYSGLADISVKTGHKKTGLFGWGKGKDLYSSILDVYPKLVDENGKFNTTLAKSVIEARELKGEGKEVLQNMINLAEEAEKAQQEVKDYLTGIFGNLGSTMSDALADAFRNGTDAAKAFGKSVGDMLENMGEQMLFSNLFGNILRDANDNMMKVMTNDTLTDEQKFDQYVGILDQMTDDVLAKRDTYNALMTKYQQMAGEKGVRIFSKEREEQNATANGISQISYDQANVLTGIATAIQIAGEQRNVKLDAANEMLSLMNARIDGFKVGDLQMLDIANDTRDMLANSYIELKEINMNTGHSAAHLKEIKEDIREMKRTIKNM